APDADGGPSGVGRAIRLPGEDAEGDPSEGARPRNAMDARHARSSACAPEHGPWGEPLTGQPVLPHVPPRDGAHRREDAGVRTRRVALGRSRAPLPLRRARPRRGRRRPHRGPWDLEADADAYADAADRWERFGVVPEQAFALLGQGRCLLRLSRPTEAASVLQRAHEIFER